MEGFPKTHTDFCFKFFSANFYVTWGARADLQTAPGAPLPPFGKAMGKLANDDLKAVIEKGLVQYSRENRELDILIFKEVSCAVLYICINVKKLVL